MDDHKRVSNLPIGAELYRSPRKQRILQHCFAQSITNFGFVGRPRLADGLGQNAHCIISCSRIPGVRIAAGERLVILDELLHLGIRQLVRPPDSGKDVVDAVAQGLAGIHFRAAGPVADHLMMHAALQVLAVHGDVVLQMSVAQKDVRPGRLDLLQQWGKIGAP